MTTNQVLEPGFAQCAVTGKIVPEDELVMINGQRVCAEGKAILLERLRAGEAIPGELLRPRMLLRLGCSIIDVLILLVPGFVIGIVTGIGVVATRTRSDTGLAVAVSVVTQSVVILYYALMHGSRGQTVGKMAGKLSVVNLNGTPINMGTAFVRAFAYGGPNLLAAITLLVDPSIGALANIVVGFYGLANVMFALLDRSQQRALHDRIAGTRVVMRA
jgi:uncharacterized RDD family membrane protein YckC